MKKIFFFLILILIAGISTGQPLKKGNVVGFHVGTVELASGVSMDQYMNYCINKLMPAYNKEFKGDISFNIVDGERGQDGTKTGRLLIIKSAKVRDKYFPKEGQTSELLKTKMQKIQPLIDELEKLGTFKEDHYTDWVVY
jgi:hypothetical protein